MAMASSWHPRLSRAAFPGVVAWWQQLRLPSKIAVIASILVIGGMTHLGTIVAGHVRESVLQRSASGAALYMDSFVARHVQELASQSTLSEESRLALERLLSPVSMHRPVIAFRIWKGDTVVFSNERDLIGRTFPRTHSRERALQGQIGIEFEQPDGDDDEQVRSLNVPILEVYAPVRERGTSRIIALVETYEIAVDLKRELWVDTLTVWAAVLAIALTVVVLLFSMASSGAVERHLLLGRMEESEQRRRRVTEAGLQVAAMNERSLRSVGAELNEGPGQSIALALLKFEALEELVAGSNAAGSPGSDGHKDDLRTIHRALSDSLRHIRSVYRSSPPPDVDHLSLQEVLAAAAARHEILRGVPVRFESHGLPEQVPLPIRASLYRFALEGLDGTFPALRQSLSASLADQSLVLEFAGSRDTPDSERHWPAGASALRDLQDRIEALGGTLCQAPTPQGGMSIVVELSLAEMEFARG